MPNTIPVLHDDDGTSYLNEVIQYDITFKGINDDDHEDKSTNNVDLEEVIGVVEENYNYDKEEVVNPVSAANSADKVNAEQDPNMTIVRHGRISRSPSQFPDITHY